MYFIWPGFQTRKSSTKEFTLQMTSHRPRVGRTFTQGSHLTNHQTLPTGQNMTEVPKVATLFYCALNKAFTKCSMLTNWVNMAISKYYTLTPGHQSIRPGRKTIRMQCAWRRFYPTIPRWEGPEIIPSKREECSKTFYLRFKYSVTWAVHLKPYNCGGRGFTQSSQGTRLFSVHVWEATQSSVCAKAGTWRWKLWNVEN